jgi:hypothetical protein
MWSCKSILVCSSCSFVRCCVHTTFEKFLTIRIPGVPPSLRIPDSSMTTWLWVLHKKLLRKPIPGPELLFLRFFTVTCSGLGASQRNDTRWWLELGPRLHIWTAPSGGTIIGATFLILVLTILLALFTYWFCVCFCMYVCMYVCMLCVLCVYTVIGAIFFIWLSWLHWCVSNTCLYVYVCVYAFWVQSYT